MTTHERHRNTCHFYCNGMTFTLGSLVLIDWDQAVLTTSGGTRVGLDSMIPGLEYEGGLPSCRSLREAYNLGYIKRTWKNKWNDPPPRHQFYEALQRLLVNGFPWEPGEVFRSDGHVIYFDVLDLYGKGREGEIRCEEIKWISRHKAGDDADLYEAIHHGWIKAVAEYDPNRGTIFEHRFEFNFDTTG